MSKYTAKLKSFLPLVVLLLSIPIAYALYVDQGPEKQANSNRTKKNRVVNVTDLTKQTVTPTWQATGMVKIAESVDLMPEVSGRIEKINPLIFPGAVIQQDEWLLELEQTDYKLDVLTQSSQLENVQAKLALELADQRLAKEELALLSVEQTLSIDTALVLREPQLMSAKAQVKIAEVNLLRAQTDLARTRISMPFTGMVSETYWAIGMRANQNTRLLKIINIEKFWIEVKIPRSFLHILDVQQPALITQANLWSAAQSRLASIKSIIPTLDPKDRQVSLLIEIEDPLNINNITPNAPQVYINDFLNIQLTGKALKDGWLIQTSWLQPDNTIWVVDNKDSLQKRPITVLHKLNHQLVVQGDFTDTDQAVTEKPRGFIVGMKVKPRQDALALQMKLQKEAFNEQPIQRKNKGADAITESTQQNEFKDGVQVEEE